MPRVVPGNLQGCEANGFGQTYCLPFFPEWCKELHFAAKNMRKKMKREINKCVLERESNRGTHTQREREWYRERKTREWERVCDRERDKETETHTHTKSYTETGEKTLIDLQRSNGNSPEKVLRSLTTSPWLNRHGRAHRILRVQINFHK